MTASLRLRSRSWELERKKKERGEREVAAAGGGRRGARVWKGARLRPLVLFEGEERGVVADVGHGRSTPPA